MKLEYGGFYVFVEWNFTASPLSEQELLEVHYIVPYGNMDNGAIGI